MRLIRRLEARLVTLRHPLAKPLRSYGEQIEGDIVMASAARHARPSAVRVRSIVISPLLNLAPAAGSAARMNHSQPLVPLGKSRICGRAMLSLSPDRRTLDIDIRFERPTAPVIRLCRLAPSEEGSGTEQHDLLVVEITAANSSQGRARAGHCFSLGRREDFGTFEETEALLDTGISLAALGAESVEGISVVPARHPGRDRAADYLDQRMRIEIAAAECSAGARAASRHVELATLYARRLRETHSSST